MKRLLSLVAVIALVASMMPGTGIAGLRGGWDPLGRPGLAAADGVTYGNGLTNGMQTPNVRPAPIGSHDGVAHMESWVSFTTRDQVVGFESSREIWQALNRTNAALLVPTIDQARQRILGDPTGLISYLDPSWSPNGRFLAYSKSNAQVTEAAIYVQEYAASTNMNVSITPIGSPILVVGGAGIRNRHPDWSPDGNSLAYDSDATGTSVDVYTVQVFPTVGSPVRHTFVNNRAEQNPAWAPDGVRIAYDTNHFGPNVIEIVDTSSDAVSLAEANFAQISHSNPDWSSDGNSIYYDAPENEDPQQNQDLWKLDLPTQAKCDMLIDGAGDVNITVSPTLNVTNDGVPYNNFWFESQALGQGLILWRGNSIQPCVPPLAMAVNFKPNSFNFDAGNPNHGNGEALNVTMSFPPETQALGYICLAENHPGREGVRMRNSLFLSPTLMGLAALDANGDVLPDYTESQGSETITCPWASRDVEARLVALGLVNKQVTMEVDAYSNIVGRQFRGFGQLQISTSSLSGSLVRLQQNAPNPFNPVTKIRFATSKPGDVALRVYNVKGELVKTLANQHYEAGAHSVMWDGRDSGGSHVASGVYYAKVSANGGSTDVIKMVMAK